MTYCLFEVLFGSLCAVIAGAKGWFDIREYILGHHDWFKNNNLFVSGIPADDTIARIISTIEPEQFHRCFIKWMSSIHTLTEGQVIAIDGKTLRGSYNRQDRASTIHMISAYAIPELINMLDIKGALVTIDAMACQTKIAKTIVEQGGDYLLAVKSNQGKLREAIVKAFSFQRSSNTDKSTIEQGHGRTECRQCYVIDSTNLVGDFSK